MSKVSIILTSYNYARYLKDTVNSVINQSFKDWELIVVDDASEDNSVEILTSFVNSEERIQLIRNFENQGLSKSIQIGLMAATGDWIAFLESDDMWREDYLERKIEAAKQHTDCGLIYNNVEYTGANTDTAEKKYQKIITTNRTLNFPRNIFYKFGYQNIILTMSSVMIKRELFDGIDFNTPIDKLLDWYLYIQIARKTCAYYIDEQLTFWRQHSDSYLGKRMGGKFKFANISAYLNILKQEPWNLKLFIFIIISTLRMCVKRLKVYLNI